MLLAYSSYTVDVDECTTPQLSALCQQKCVNTRGRFVIFLPTTN